MTQMVKVKVNDHHRLCYGGTVYEPGQTLNLPIIVACEASVAGTVTYLHDVLEPRARKARP